MDSAFYQDLYTSLQELVTSRALSVCPTGIAYTLKEDWSFVRLDDGNQAVQQVLLLPNKKALRRYSYLEPILGDAPHQASRYQEGLLICFGSRRDIKGEDYERIRTSEVKFRGKRAWPLLRLLAPPAWPLRPTGALLMAFLPLIKDLSRTIMESALSEDWPDIAEAMEIEVGEMIDDSHLDALRMLPQTEENWLLDAVVLPGTRVRPEEDAPSVMTQALLLAKFQDDKPFHVEIAKQAGLIDEELVDFFIRHLEQHERPASLTVRDPEQRSYLASVCEALGIHLIVRSALPVIDPYLPQLQGKLLNSDGSTDGSAPVGHES